MWLRSLWEGRGNDGRSRTFPETVRMVDQRSERGPAVAGGGTFNRPGDGAPGDGGAVTRGSASCPGTAAFGHG